MARVHIEKRADPGRAAEATKIYLNGTTEPFKGAFINRTSFDSPTDKGETQFGLGVVGTSRQVVYGVNVDRVSYQRKR